MTDYIRLPRSALSEELWRNNGALLRVFMYLVRQSDNGVTDTSVAQICRATRLTERQVRDTLTELERSNKTSSKRSNKGSSITLCDIGDSNTLRSNKTSSKRSNKGSNENTLPIPMSEVVSAPSFVAPEYAETWRRFIAYRKEIKKPYKSELSERIAYNKMVEMADNDPAAAKDMVERTILGQWQGLFPKENHGTKPIITTDNAATRKESRDRLRSLATGVVSQSADKLLDLYNGVGQNPDDSQHYKQCVVGRCPRPVVYCCL